ncbi:glutamine synthetase/guanido kinase [Auriculariales sp. MPI-PUGE-AT-0066]|nr:glutamine synthetase/guanido kinase [Auriculariales sp. MPI-PUGE-AT-0066]
MSTDSPKDTAHTLAELKELLAKDNKVKVAGIDVDGVLRGKFMSRDKFLSAAKDDGFGFCSVIFGWDMHDVVYPKELLVSNKANGYRDILARIDLSLMRRIPWEEQVPLFLLSFLDPETKQPIPVCPRGTLAKAIKLADQSGWTCMAGCEYEYFQFKETPYSAADKGYTNLSPLTPGMHGYSMLRTTLNQQYFHDLFDMAEQFDIQIEGHHTETGPGVFETALAYTDALRMADNAILFKLLAKSVGVKHGIMPSFMAKPWGNLPGCSGHTHVSLRDKSGRNIFGLHDNQLKTGRPEAQHEDTRFISQEAEWFLAGILEGLADVVPLLVPTINGYKRLVGGEAFWAPNAVTYGYDSRAASIRIISPPSCSPTATRFEVRVPGADMLPHYTMSAIFLLGLRGIERKSKLPCEPIAVLQARPGGKESVRKLARSLEEATAQMMQPDSIAREILGDEFVDHFGGTREHEVAQWNQAVTNWEVERYLELA